MLTLENRTAVDAVTKAEEEVSRLAGLPESDPSTRGIRVQVYWNIQQHRFSVVDLATGRVIPDLHPESLVLRDATFVVQRAGRERVRRERRKNVHAFVRGVLWTGEPPEAAWQGVAYNPYVDDRWTDREARKGVVAAKWARLTNDQGKAVVHYDTLTAHALSPL